MYVARKIRSFHPGTSSHGVLEEAKQACAVPLPPRRRQSSQAPVMQAQICGVSREQFPGLPNELWNRLVGTFRAGVINTCRELEAVFVKGSEDKLVNLLDTGLPQVLNHLGCEVAETLLEECRESWGTWLRCPTCEQRSLKLQGYRSRSFLTRQGRVSARRAYYHCAGCGESVAPLDELLGLQGHDALPSLQETVARLASEVPYDTAVEIVSRLLPVTISNETAQRITATVAADLQEEQKADLKAAFEDPSRSCFPAPSRRPSNPVALVALDGGMCRIRDQDTFSEFKVGVLGTLDPSTASPRKPAKVQDKHYVAHFAPADKIVDYVNVEMHRQGLHLCPTLHVIADGAPWIWARAPLLAAQGQELILTLDFYHASEHLADLAKVLLPGADDKTRAWAQHMAGLLK
jgi:hypothetical protein